MTTALDQRRAALDAKQRQVRERRAKVKQDKERSRFVRTTSHGKTQLLQFIAGMQTPCTRTIRELAQAVGSSTADTRYLLECLRFRGWLRVSDTTRAWQITDKGWRHLKNRQKRLVR